MENWEKAKLIADKFGVLQKEDGDINDDVLLAIESALSQHDVSSRRELLVAFTTHILDKLTEYEGQEINEEMVDDFLATNSY